MTAVLIMTSDLSHLHDRAKSHVIWVSHVGLDCHAGLGLNVKNLKGIKKKTCTKE